MRWISTERDPAQHLVEPHHLHDLGHVSCVVYTERDPEHLITEGYNRDDPDCVI